MHQTHDQVNIGCHHRHYHLQNESHDQQCVWASKSNNTLEQLESINKKTLMKLQNSVLTMQNIVHT
jgi:hypothetical protein